MNEQNIGPQVYGGFWHRFLAYLLDVVILTVTNLVIMAVLGGLIGVLGGPDQSERGILLSVLAFQLVSFGITVAYFGILQAKMEGTPGKRIVGLRLVSETLQPLTVGQGLIRYLMFIVSSVPFFAGLILAGVHSRKQGWHDRVARTLVVRNDYLQQMRSGSSPSVPGTGKAPVGSRQAA